ncbi:MAG: hypothetical protein ABSG26_16615 [Bryobacteraceae bacterium]|jgi:predicted aspartyl protease
MPSKDPILTGSLSDTGHPVIKITVFGIHPDLKQEFEVMIDTGFTGFLLMPIMSAFPLGLTLVGTGNYTLADDSTSPKLLAIGSVIVGNEDPVHGVIVLAGVYKLSASGRAGIDAGFSARPAIN